MLAGFHALDWQLASLHQIRTCQIKAYLSNFPGAPWLNPTPHAIAVYASQPLSPEATQHSLPCGCYFLHGPEFHGLDRTSFALAHSFDHFVSTGE